MSEERQEFKTGAARSKLKGRADLIPKAAIDAMARRLELGTKYGENNWRLGGEDFRKATIGHLIVHVMDYLENGNSQDENSDAIICNAAFLCQYELENPFPGVKAVVERAQKQKMDTEDEVQGDSAVLVRRTIPTLDVVNSAIRRVLGENDRRTHAQQADAIVKELFTQ